MNSHRLTKEEMAEAMEEGRKAERARCAAILRSSAARGRIKQAEHLALKTDMSADEAIKVLAQSPIDPNDPINPIPKQGNTGVFSEPSPKEQGEAAVDAAWARTLGQLN